MVRLACALAVVAACVACDAPPGGTLGILLSPRDDGHFFEGHLHDVTVAPPLARPPGDARVAWSLSGTADPGNGSEGGPVTLDILISANDVTGAAIAVHVPPVGTTGLDVTVTSLSFEQRFSIVALDADGVAFAAGQVPMEQAGDVVMTRGSELGANYIGACSLLSRSFSLDVKRADHELVLKNGEEGRLPGPHVLRVHHFSTVGFERTLGFGSCTDGPSDQSNFLIDRVAE